MTEPVPAAPGGALPLASPAAGLTSTPTAAAVPGAAPAPAPAPGAGPEPRAGLGPHSTPAICAIFLLSGVAGLIYEIVWTRRLLLVFGSTSFAVGTVLAAFMSGLALGSRLFGRRADRAGDPLLLYAVLEFAIGAYGLASPQLVDLLEAVYGSLHAALAPGFGLSVALRFCLATAFILVPTACMGGTLPVLARHVSRGEGGSAARVGLLYAVNTTGAVLGTLLGGLWLLPHLGVSLTLRVAGVLNLAAGAFALALRAPALDAGTATSALAAPAGLVPPSREAAAGDSAPHSRTVPLSRDAGEARGEGASHAAPSPSLPPAVPTVPPADSVAPAAVLLAVALSGFASFLYEVAWTRTLHMIVGSTHDALTVMLAAFLVGIAAGSAAIARLADRVRSPRALFLGIELGIAVLALLVIPLFGQLPYVLISWQSFLRESHARFVVFKFALSMAAMLGPTFLLGAAFPVAIRLFLGGLPDVGGRLGRLYLWNTAGCILGALAAAFALIPSIGALGTARVGAVANALAGLVLWLWGADALRRLPRALAAVAGVLALLALVPDWDRTSVTSAPYMYAYQFEGMDRERIQRILRSAPIVYDREGLDSVVTVRKSSKELLFQINGKTEASTGPGQLDALVLLSEIPLQLHPEPKDALVIGWGLGVSVGALTRHPSVQSIDVVELERAVLGAADLFAEQNYDAAHNPRVHVRFDDGRNFTALTKKKYDIITSDAPDCWVTGPSHLFTVEHLRNVKARLRPGGLLSQWVALGSLTEEALLSLLRTFGEVFEHVSVWETPHPLEQILVASDSPMVLDCARFRRRLEVPTIRADLERISLTDPAAFAACRIGELPREAWAEAVMNTDDLPVLEFTPRANFLRAGSSIETHDWLVRRRGAYRMAVEGIPEAEREAFLRELARRLEDHPDPLAALQVHAVIAGLYPADIVSLHEEVRILLQLGRPDLALAPAAAALKLVPENAKANFLLGASLARVGKFEESLALLGKASAGGYEDPVVRYLLARSLLELKRWDEAESPLAEFLKAVPEDRDGLSAMAYLWEKRGEPAKALPFVEKALGVEQRPNFRQALLAQLQRLRRAAGPAK
ncbi:MAG: fused MFS/spermidine synthase [Planctomycetes bacterium]|nr:fused MFS/spermidine synthase [Planctomycetota bacterium]